MARLGPLAQIAVQGTLVETLVRCGTPSCGCHRDPARRHGPHLYLKFRDATTGKASAIYVPKTRVAEVRRAIDAWNDLWRTSVAVSAENRAALRTALRRRPHGADGE